MLSNRRESLLSLHEILLLKYHLSPWNTCSLYRWVFWWGCCLLAPSHTCLVLCVQQADSRVSPTVIYFHPASRSPGAAEHHPRHNTAATKTSKRPVVLSTLTQKGSYAIFNLWRHGFAWLYWKTVSAMSPSFGEESTYTNKICNCMTSYRGHIVFWNPMTLI